jgi:hypothetical protein
MASSKPVRSTGEDNVWLKAWLVRITEWFELLTKFLKPVREILIIVVAIFLAVTVPTTFERPTAFYASNPAPTPWTRLNSDFWGTPDTGYQLLNFDVKGFDDEKMLQPYGSGSRITFPKSGVYLISISLPLDDAGTTVYGGITAATNNDIARRFVVVSLQSAGQDGWGNTLSGVVTDYFKAGDTLDLYLSLRSHKPRQPIVGRSTLSVTMVNAYRDRQDNFWALVGSYFSKK